MAASLLRHKTPKTNHASIRRYLSAVSSSSPFCCVSTSFSHYRTPCVPHSSHVSRQGARRLPIHYFHHIPRISGLGVSPLSRSISTITKSAVAKRFSSLANSHLATASSFSSPPSAKKEEERKKEKEKEKESRVDQANLTQNEGTLILQLKFHLRHEKQAIPAVFDKLKQTNSWREAWQLLMQYEAQRGNSERMQELLEDVQRTHPQQFDTNDANFAMNCFGIVGDLPMMQKLLNTMIERQIPRSTQTYSTFFKALCSDQLIFIFGASADLVEDIKKHMEQDGIHPETNISKYMACYLIKAGATEEFFSSFGYLSIPQSAPPPTNTIDVNEVALSAITALCERNDLLSARKVLFAITTKADQDDETNTQQQPPLDADIISRCYNALIAAEARFGHLNTTKLLLSEMYCHGVGPTNLSYCAIVHGATNGKQHDLIRYIVHEHEFSWTADTSEALLKATALLGTQDIFYFVLKRMRQHGIPITPSMEVPSCLAYAKFNQIELLEASLDRLFAATAKNPGRPRRQSSSLPPSLLSSEEYSISWLLRQFVGMRLYPQLYLMLQKISERPAVWNMDLALSLSFELAVIDRISCNALRMAIDNASTPLIPKVRYFLSKILPKVASAAKLAAEQVTASPAATPSPDNEIKYKLKQLKVTLQNKHFAEAEALFQSLKEHTIDAYHLMFSYVIEHLGLESLMNYWMELKQYHSPTTTSYMFILSSLAAFNHTTTLKRLFYDMYLLDTPRNQPVYISVLSALNLEPVLKVQELQGIIRLLYKDNLSLGSTIYGVLAVSYGLLGSNSHMEQMIKNAEKIGSRPLLAVYHKMMRNFCERGHWKKILHVANMVLQKKPVLLDIKHWTVVLTCLKTAGKYEDMMEVFRKMKQQDVAVNTITITTIIDGLGKSGHLEKMWQMYQQYRSFANTITFNCMLQAFALNQNSMGIKKVLADMNRRTNLEVDLINWNSLIDAYEQCGRLDLIRPLVSQILQAKDRYGRAKYSRLIESFHSWFFRPRVITNITSTFARHQCHEDLLHIIQELVAYEQNSPFLPESVKPFLPPHISLERNELLLQMEAPSQAVAQNAASPT